MIGTMTRLKARIAKAILIGGVVISLAACAAQFRNHGYAPTDAELAEVLVGVDIRDSVIELVGPPTAGGVTNDAGLYYVASRWRYFAYQQPRPIDRQVVAITFDDADFVANIERFTLEDGKVVPISRRVTDSNVQGVTFLRQLLGNLGRFDAGTVLNPDG
ncbi:outer membrane protein assembly factor BamE [Nereida sp. MMG025]|uniref:outer membrane protein assembly factor BamE n=1 Tax=Nereida sp. MMG025 TaxID=2909981 RepID=UPI001F0164AD|nr:outer membrane protein assembly factor BamE [Nereida sp. MMG025]MCF6443523.1 outer membrane protein assembly factor BamE [Nereida sp. MMG025]